MIEEEQCNLSGESLSTCRVDKRAAHQTESGSNNVSCRSVLKGSSQGSCLTSSSICAQGNHKKNIRTKAEGEIPKGSLVSAPPSSWYQLLDSLTGWFGFFLPLDENMWARHYGVKRKLKQEKKRGKAW